MNTIGALDTFWQDLRYAARMFSRSAGFTAVAVLTLGLGIGGVTIIYSVIRDILLNPFPYTDSRRMVDVLVYNTATGTFRGQMRSSELLDYERQSDVFEDAIGTISAEPMTMPTTEGAKVLAVARVTPNAFSFLGVRPLLGRGITESDGRSDAPPIIVLSHNAWIAQFGGAPDVVGRTLTLQAASPRPEAPSSASPSSRTTLVDSPGEVRTIVGVMPPRFTWHVADGWIPQALDPSRGDKEAQAFWLQARLKPGVTPEEAEARLNVIATRRAEHHPTEYPERFHVSVVSVIDFVVGRFRGVLYTLFGAVALLLLIACCNVANMLMARATVRERELTLRAALGASRMRLVRQLLIESLLLALAGAAAGCLVAYGGVAAVAHFLPQQNVPYEVELRLRTSALVFSMLTGGVTALLFGLLPAVYGARRDLVQALKGAGRATGVGQGWIRNGLVVVEIAFSMVLLLGAGVLMRNFATLVRVNLGFDPSRVVFATVRFPAGSRVTGAERQAYYERAVERVSGLPGVAAAAQNLTWPFGAMPTTLEIPGVQISPSPEARVSLCDDGYLGVLGIGTTRGRALTPADVTGARMVALVNETLAKRYFGDSDPLGRAIRLAALAKLPDPVRDPTFEIVGVVPDIPNRGGRETLPGAYVPATITTSFTRAIVVRTSGDPVPMIGPITRALGGVDRTVAVDRVIALDEALRSLYAQPRFTTIVLAAFAGIGLLLVGIGVYGVMAYAVSRRTQEIGVRVALGAERRHVLRSVLVAGARVLLVGLGAGLLASLGTNRLLASQLWKTSPYDPFTMVAAVVVIGLVGLGACYVPARRAASVDPMLALRHE